MDKIEKHEIADVFNHYPENIRQKLMLLRQMILDTASETEGVSEVEETLKWGEPSYLVVGGSTVRIAWKKSKPNCYAIYFHCKTTLVDTFKELYGNKFCFEGNRAILFKENDVLPIPELKHCISLSLTYHSRKHLPMLGV